MTGTDLTVLIAVPALLAVTVGAVVLLTGWLDRHGEHGRKKG
jgi:hypothetical protein